MSTIFRCSPTANNTTRWMVPIVKFQGCRFGPQKIATNPWFHQYLTSKWEWSAAGWKCQDVFSGTNLQPWILVKGEWLWVEIYIYIVPYFFMAVGSFFGLRFLEKNGRLFRWFFRILKTDKSQSKHPKKNANSSRRNVKMKNSSENSRKKEQPATPKNSVETNVLRS